MEVPLKEQLRKLLLRTKQLFARLGWQFILQTALVITAFVVPIVILYGFDPLSFEFLWKGRAPYFLFIWLLFLEIILSWKSLKEGARKFWTWKTVLGAAVLMLPTIYAVGMRLFRWEVGIWGLGTAVGVPVERYGEWFLTDSWLFSFEFVLFTVFFVASIWLLYGVKGLKRFVISAFFLGGIGVFYMIDTFYPYGTFTVLQSFVPVTVFGASSILNLLGYGTQTYPGGTNGLGLSVTGAGGSYYALVSWSCAGSHSLFLYSFMIMLFLRGTGISRMRKIIYIVVGAVGTFFVNILRVVAILTAGVGGGNALATQFHEFYGEFFFIAWMFIYLTVVFLSETRLVGKISSVRRSNQPLTGTSQPTLP
jgi:thaumarchaeosortase